MISAWQTTNRQSFKKVTCPINLGDDVGKLWNFNQEITRNSKKGHSWSPENVFQFPEIATWFCENVTRFPEIVPQIPENVTQFTQSVTRFPESRTRFPENMTPFTSDQIFCHFYDEKVLGIL